jgi:hypothetical protein
MGILVYIFSMSKEHICISLFILISFSEWANVLVFCTLNAIGNCRILVRIVYKCLANL